MIYFLLLKELEMEIKIVQNPHILFTDRVIMNITPKNKAGVTSHTSSVII